MLQIKMLEKYFKNIIINSVFSFVMMLVIHVKLLVIKAEAFPMYNILVLFICEFVSVIACCIIACFILRTRPKRIIKLVTTCVLWTVLFFFESWLVRMLCINATLSEGIMFFICSVIYSLLFAIMVLCLCHTIKDCKIGFCNVIFQHIFSLVKFYIGCIAVFVAFCIAAFAPVNTRGGRNTLVIVPKETTIRWERRIFVVLLFFFIPLYTVALIQKYEELEEVS